MEPVTLAPENLPVPPTGLAPVTNAPADPLPPAQAGKRAEKAEMGLGTVTGDSYKDMYAKIAAGEEDDFRRVSASKIDFERSMARDQALTDWAAKKGGPLTIDEAIRVVDPFTRDGRADPRDVIEKAYAEKYVSMANTAATYMKGTVLEQGILELPETTAKTQEKASEITTRFELLRTMKENVDNDLSNQGWLPWAADQAKMMIQPYNEAKMRGLNPDVGVVSGGLLLGENIKEQADRLWDLPYPKFKEGVTKIVDGLRKDNPTLAAQFLDYMTAPNTRQRVLDNIFTAIMPADYAAIAKTPSLLRKVELNNRVNKAFKDVVASSANVGKEIPAKAVAEEGAGNVAQAGITRATENITRTLDGTLNPVQDIKEKMTSNYRLDGDVFDTNPGSGYLSREILTRMKDAFYSRGNNLYETITNALRVNRTPIPLATEDALKAYQVAARNDFPGLDNSILDISDPIYDPVTNTNHIAFTFGNRDGRIFSSVEKARAYAKDHGFAEPRVVKAEGTVEIEAARFQGKADDIRTKERLEKSIPKTEDLVRRERAKAYNKTLTKEVRDAAREQFKLAKEFLKEEKARLKDVNTRVTMGEPVIEQNGLGFTFKVVRPYKETDDVVRKWHINKDEGGKFYGEGASSASREGFSGWKNSILGWIRGADDTLAFNESLQRKTAVYTQSLLREWAKDDAQLIENLANRFKWYKPQTWLGKVFSNKEVFEQWNDTLKFAKTRPDPDTGEIGSFFKTPGDLEDHYQRWYQRSPSVPEVEAYFAHVRLIEADRVLSEIAEFRNRSRLGAEQHQIYVQQGTTRVASGFFDGIHQQEFPRGDDNVIVMGGRLGEEKIFNLQHIPTKERQKLEQAVKEGRQRVIRIYDPDSNPLKAMSDIAGSKRIRYVITNSSETKPLDFNHVNRRGGGHFDVDADFFIKQANMVDESTGLYPDLASKFRRIYRGDTTLMPIANRRMGTDIVAKMNKINKYMASGQEDLAKAEGQSLGIDWDELSSWYKPSRDKDGKVVAPSINPNEPFYVVSRNKKIFDIDKSLEERHAGLFKDGTKSGSDALQFKVAYNEVRDSSNLKTIRDEGTQGNPLYKYVPADYVDPIPTMNRALNRAINSTFMDDYKIYAVEHWLTEAIPHLKASESEVRSAPFYHFNTASDKGAFKPDTPESIRWNLLSNRYKINQFVGTPSSMDTAIHGLTQLMADKFYEKFGPEATRGVVGKAATLVPLWMLDKVKEPVSAIRSFAFNAKLGIFALPQFIVQAQTYTTIFALNPRQAMAGTYAYMLHSWARVNGHPEVLAAMDRYASKMKLFGSNWKPGEWAEARRELARTGFENVGGEHAIADDAMQYKTIKNEWNNFLSAGQVFFREGEKASRIGAYYTAFKEFRDANPVKVITDVDRQRILQKADLLTVNMSRASSSALHGGVLSLTTQFLSYQLRMAELFFGKRIGETTAERTLARARLMTMYAAMYGAPSALGITGYPFGDSIREHAITNGYQVGDKFLSSLMMEGIPAMSLAMITGKGDFQKGNFYNIGDRYGSQGFTQIRESLRTDKTMWSIFGGAGVNSIVNTIANLDPFWKAAKHLMSDDEEGNTFKLKVNDFVNLFNEVSTVDASTRWYRALNTGRWITKNGQYVDDVSASNATFMAMITGTKPQEQDDIYSVKNIKDTEKKIWAKAQKAITQDYQRGIEAADNNDPNTATDYFNRVRARMIIDNIPLDMRADILSKATRGYEKTIDTSQKYWATKAVPAGQEESRMDSYTRYLQLQDKRHQ